jgi:hypothetical protein
MKQIVHFANVETNGNVTTIIGWVPCVLNFGNHVCLLQPHEHGSTMGCQCDLFGGI